MSNLWGEEEEEFQDRPEAASTVKKPQNAAQLANQLIPPIATAPIHQNPRAPAEPVRQAPAPRPVAEEFSDEVEELVESLDQEEEDFETVLNDANLRIESGRLYQMVMNHDLFEGMEVDARAVASVQREIRKFAKERMEIMLGMRQERLAEQYAEYNAKLSNPFNDLEVEILKKLASKATNGATESAEANQVAATLRETAPPKRTTLTPIGQKAPVKQPQRLAPRAPGAKLPSKAPVPLKRTRLDATIEQVAAEEGIPVEELRKHVTDGYTPMDKPLVALSGEEQARRIKESQERLSRHRTVKSTSALPMATPEQEAALAVQRATQIGTAPGMAALLAKVSSMPTKE